MILSGCEIAIGIGIECLLHVKLRISPNKKYHHPDPDKPELNIQRPMIKFQQG